MQVFLLTLSSMSNVERRLGYFSNSRHEWGVLQERPLFVRVQYQQYSYQTVGSVYRNACCKVSYINRLPYIVYQCTTGSLPMLALTMVARQQPRLPCTLLTGSVGHQRYSDNTTGVSRQERRCPCDARAHVYTHTCSSS